MLLLIKFWIFHWLGCFSGIGQMSLLFSLTYPFVRCLFGHGLVVKLVLSRISRTRVVVNINSFMVPPTSWVLKILLIIRLRAIWNKDFTGKRSTNTVLWTCYNDNFGSSHTDSIFHDGRYVCRILLLTKRDDWLSKLAQILVCFGDAILTHQLILFFKLRCREWY